MPWWPAERLGVLPAVVARGVPVLKGELGPALAGEHACTHHGCIFSGG